MNWLGFALLVAVTGGGAASAQDFLLIQSPTWTKRVEAAQVVKSGVWQFDGASRDVYVEFDSDLSAEIDSLLRKTSKDESVVLVLCGHQVQGFSELEFPFSSLHVFFPDSKDFVERAQTLDSALKTGRCD